ncbi:hypothetical protein M4I32_01850 [Microbacterium sp. LRZ72]|uniref:hypothetical protein n=1 Tax=Microbacterium sp. LRZ72 TaxID=2942481 RepID=UPI0029B39358|nr:hypothetical protein [Microbacterium sp. LRZ72]MDX2375539.1 hypothetical protein [Microbacterium sp. LRZ72]
MSSASSRSSRPDPLAQAIADAARSVLLAASALGTEQAPVVLIDGRSGAGKSSLANVLVRTWPGADAPQLLALDSVYPGWEGLREGVDLVLRDVLVPRARGDDAQWRRYDWEIGAYAEAHTVEADRPLIVEGVGILTSESARLSDIRLWLEAPDDSRRNRALDRDGDLFRPHWERWARQEERHIARHDPRALATIEQRMP